MILKWGGKGKALLTEEVQLISIEGSIKLESHHWQTTVVITDCGNNQP